MPRNKLTDLRNHLFETLERLTQDDKPMEVARAKAVCSVAQTIINSAKVEVDFLNVTGREVRGGDFFERPALEAENRGEKPTPISHLRAGRRG